MRPSELGYWEALWLTDPWGPARVEFGHAIIASTVANGLMKKGTGGGFVPAEFMPYYVRPPEDPATLDARIWGAFGKSAGAGNAA